MDKKPLYKLEYKEENVAIWMGCWFDEENDYIGWYDHDNSEGCTGIEGSWSKSYAEEVTAVASKYSDNYQKCYFFKLFGYHVDAPVGQLDIPAETKGVNFETIQPGYFLGNFHYSENPYVV